MIQGFPTQLIPGEVGSDMTTASRPEISDLCNLDGCVLTGSSRPELQQSVEYELREFDSSRGYDD